MWYYKCHHTGGAMVAMLQVEPYLTQEVLEGEECRSVLRFVCPAL